MGEITDRLRLLHHAEEVGLLEDDRCRRGADSLLQFCRVDPAVDAWGDSDDFVQLRVRVGL